MGDRYVELDSVAFETFLQENGFSRTVTKNEVVYIRRHHKLPDLMVKVYTSIGIGDNAARSCGADAIRVVSVFDNGQRSFGVGKFPRIYRTAPIGLPHDSRQKHVFDRTLERMREAYARCNEWLKEQGQRRAASMAR